MDFNGDFKLPTLDIELNTLNPVEYDPDEVIRCNSDEDCPDNSHCSIKNVDVRFVCVCVRGLIVAKKNHNCTETSVVVKNDDKDIGVIPLHKDFHQVAGEQTEYTSEEGGNTTQISTTTMSAPFVANISLSDVAFKVLIPLAGILLLTLIVFVVLYRHFRVCRKKKRGKNSAIVKASEDIQLLDKMNIVNKNPSYFGPNADRYGQKMSVTDIPVERIRLLEVVGEGAFGQVYKGELLAPDLQVCRKVAVKVLKDGVSNEAREDFEREVEIMSAFDHDNILKLLGTVSTGQQETPYMVFEYMMHGDLAELLRKNDPSIKNVDTPLILQKLKLVDITIQIANGMTYLTSQHFVHRDLATRNCLVGDSCIVKISDFGMSRDIYTCDYYKIGGSRMLPVRWMSPEAVKWGRFTIDSDIWAFGVVLWEIFSYGRQPYYGHTNEEVIRFLDEGILLQRPEECPSIVYHVMLQCWKIDPKERLAFHRIHKYLTEYSKQLNKNTKNSSFDIVNEYEIPL
ncbi:hypothetical protein ACF0H5_023373 [Mactra antiquata]